MIILDQFDEYFLYQQAGAPFERELARITNELDDVASVLISIREDMISKLDRFEGRIPALFDNLLRVEHLDRDGAGAAIVEPLERFRERRTSAEPGLVETVLDELETASIGLAASYDGPPRDTPLVNEGQIETPYLQLVMSRLWEEEVRLGSSELRVATFRTRLGGARRIVETHLDATMEALDPEERDIAAKALRFLVTPSGTKISLSTRDLADADYADVPLEELSAVLKRLARQDVRILRTVPAPASDVQRYEIFHDVLAAAIRDWRARWEKRRIGDLLVREEEDIEPPAEPGGAAEEGIALCLSGGGYRAMLFQAGCLWRLNEVGFLGRLSRISSVSGGSIAAAQLAIAWHDLGLGQGGVAAHFFDRVIGPLRSLACRTIDSKGILGGLVTPASIGEKVAAAYKEHLLGDRTLQDLPDEPRFIINATNLQSGVLWHFSKPYMSDYRVGVVTNPTVELATAVAASAAFPPFLSPVRLKLDDDAFTPGSGADLQYPPFTTDVVLIDGTIYDNLGLETVWKRYRTVLVSDGSGSIAASPKPGTDWLRQTPRVLSVVDGQIRGLRKRQVIGSFRAGLRQGAYWGIGSVISSYAVPDPLPCDPELTRRLANTPTRLAAMPRELQERLINWGYAVCDAALRSHVDVSLAPPESFPYPAAGVG